MPPENNEIKELIKGQARMETLLKCIPAVKEAISDLRVGMAKVETTVGKLYEGCPHQIEIAKGMNNITRVDKLEEEVKALNDKQHDDRLVTTKGLAKIALVVAAAGMAGANVNLSGLLGLFN